MREVAAACGMTVGNLYYYFASKDELLAFCQEAAMGRLHHLAHCVELRNDLDADGQLFFLVLGHVVCLNEAFPGSLAHTQIEDLPAAWRDRIVSARDLYEAQWRAVVGRGVERGLFEVADEKVATMAMLGAANWTVKWYRPDGERSAYEVGEQFARQLVRGLLTDAAQWQPPTIDVDELNRIFDRDDSVASHAALAKRN